MRRTTALLVGGAIAAALALGGLVGGVLAECPSAGPASHRAEALAERALSVAAGGVAAATVAELEEEVRARPGDADVLAQLGFAYQLRWRETADPSFLPRSETCAARGPSAARPGDASAVLGLGSLALIQHEFREALRYGRQAQRLLPGSARPLGVIGDALVELGRYPEAFAAFERMAALRPNLASYARIAYARELTGDLEGAAAAMQSRARHRGGQPEPTAWSLVELAKLELRLGRVELGAAACAGTRFASCPGIPRRRSSSRESRQREDDSTPRSSRRSERPTPSRPTAAVGRLAELLDRTGRTREARRQRAVVASPNGCCAPSGVQVDLESAVFRADHRIAPRETVALARRARAARVRRSTATTRSRWALARAGRCAEALPLATARFGSAPGSAPLLPPRLRARAAREIAQRCATRTSARSGSNPAFSVRWAPVARAALGAG